MNDETQRNWRLRPGTDGSVCLCAENGRYPPIRRFRHRHRHRYYALLACKFGAKKVYAIEPNDAIDLARALTEANGFAGRIEFIQGISTTITLPERADVIVSDLRGSVPLFGQHTSTNPDVGAEIEQTAVRDGMAHGLLV